MSSNRVRNIAAAATLCVLAMPGIGHAATGPGDSVINRAVTLNAPGSEFEGAFDTLLAAVLVADPIVLQKLSDVGQHTIFAPTDDAFAALGLDESSITALDRDTLTQILLYHIIQGRINAGIVTSRDELKMLTGLRVQQSGGVLTDETGGQANIIVTDEKTENGLIHAIDAVLMPFDM
jgi:uncharacterized surface protein with fasciclin (FAS1) repeats